MISAAQSLFCRTMSSSRSSRVRAIAGILIFLGASTYCFEPAPAAAFCSTVQSAADRAQSPGIQATIKSLMYAMYSNDVATYQKCIVPEPHSNDLLNADKRLDAGELKKLRAEVDEMQMRQVSPFTIDGQEVKPKYPIGTKTTYMAQFRGYLMAIPVVNTESG